MQRSAKYVGYGVQFLAPQSATGTVAIIGHSQGAPFYVGSQSLDIGDVRLFLDAGGGVNPQHALTYWPSIRPLVANYISLAGVSWTGEPDESLSRADLFNP